MRQTLMRIDRYNKGAIAFHWAIAILIIANLAIGLFHEGLPRSWGLMPLHKSIGLTVLVLTVGRIGWRLAHRPPPLPPVVSGAQRVAAHAVHLALYALMLLMPITGWVLVSNGGKLRPLNWFGLFDVPYLKLSPAAGDAAGTGHMVLGYLMAALVALHIAAALYHHLARRDGVLARMIPGLASTKV